MQRYHLEVEGIPEYINMLEDAQRKSGRAGQTIADKTLILFNTMVMLTIDQFPRANDDWEERAERDKTWMQWKLAYKKTHAQERIKAKANEVTAKFGAANSAARQETRPTVDNQLEVEDGGIKALEGYFDDLSAAAINEKYVLQQLVLNNTTLVTSNESLAALVKKLTGDIKNLERDNSCLNKCGQVRGRSTTLVHHCKKEG